MNENPEGTPNPLNSNSGQGRESDLAPEPQPMPESMPEEPATDLVVETTSLTEETVIEPIEKSSEVKLDGGKKSKKTMWIIVAMVAIIAAIGCAVAAVLLLNNSGGDNTLSTAVTKLLNGETPKNVAMDGVINMVTDDASSDITAMKVDFDAELATMYDTGNVGVTLTLVFQDESEMTLSVDEVTAADGDIYLRIDGLAQSIETMLGSESGMGAEETVMILGIFEMIEGEWLRIPAGSLEEGAMLPLDEQTQCMVDAISGLGNSTNSLGELYKQNPFIVQSEESVKIAQKQDTLYRLDIDDEKAKSFGEAFKNSEIGKEITSCVRTMDNEIEDEVESTFADPAIYVEIDENNDFTRLYIDSTAKDGSTTITADISFSYPATIEVTEPADYTDIDDFFSGLFSGYSTDVVIVE